MADTLPKKPMSAKSKKISDIASMFGGMAKRKKVKTPRHFRKSSNQSENDIFKKTMEKLKHIDDSKKNLFAMKLSSENVYDYNLRKSPLPHSKYSNGDDSPMPPLFTLQKRASSTSSCDISSYQEKAPCSFIDCPELQLLNSKDNEVVNSNSSISNQKINLKPIGDNKSYNLSSKTREEIDLNAVKSNLKKIIKSKEDNKEEMDLLNLSEDNGLNINEDIADNHTPKSVSIGASSTENENISNLSLENKDIVTYQRKRTWSGSNASNEDTELDDVSSSHSNSIKKESNSSIVITVNPPKTEEEIDEIDTNNINIETESETVSNININRNGVPEPTEDEDKENEEERIGVINSPKILSPKPFKSEMDKIEINVDYNCFAESDKSDGSNSIYSSDENDTSSSSLSCTDSDDEETSVSLKHRIKKKHFKNISLDTGDGGSTKNVFPDYSNYTDLLGNNGELMIGKITTPTFRKKQEIEKKKQKRAQTAISSKTWDYNELFGDTEDGEMVIGAITTPKFAKKRKDAKQNGNKKISKTPEISPIKTTNNNNNNNNNGNEQDYSSTFDLSDILGDGFNLDDMDKNNIGGGRHGVFQNNYDLIPESEERSYYYSDNDESHETDDSFTESGSSQYSDYSDYTDDDDEYPGDITPETPTDIDLVPPLKSHNLSISTTNVMDIVNTIDITPSIEPSEPEEDIPELPKEEDIATPIEYILPPELQGSDSDDDEPEPAPSKLEIQVQEEKKIQKEFDEIRKEIERDMIDEEEMKRIENKRQQQIQHDLDTFFDTVSFKSDDEEEQEKKEKEEEEEEEVKIDKNIDNMDNVKMCDDLTALMAGLSDEDDGDHDDDDDDDKQIIEAMDKRRSLEDDMNEMEEEDNEPLGDENIELNINNNNNNNNNDIKEDEEDEEEEEHELDRMTLSELMSDFKLNPSTNNVNNKLYSYFHNDLGIIFASDLVNYLPSKITQPPNFKSTKTRMLLTKMAKYVTNQVLHNYWKGSKSANWAQLETNQLTYTFGPTQPITKQINMISTTDSPSVLFEMSPINMNDKDNDNDDKKSNKISTTTAIINKTEQTNRIQIVGHKMTCIDKKIELNKQYAAIINIEELPEINNKSKERHIVSMGVKFYFKDKQHRKNKLMETVYISDRCVIHRNDSYLEMLSIANCIMLDNGSQVLIEIDNKKNYPIITFSQLRNGKIIKGNKKSIILDDFKQNDRSFAKIFVQQHYGNGIYSIHQTKFKKKQQQKHNENNNNNNNNSKSSIKANIEKFRRSASKQNIRKSKHRASV